MDLVRVTLDLFIYIPLNILHMNPTPPYGLPFSTTSGFTLFTKHTSSENIPFTELISLTYNQCLLKNKILFSDNICEKYDKELFNPLQLKVAILKDLDGLKDMMQLTKHVCQKCYNNINI